jgi:protein-glutamine gamma-glutamyltransferase
MYDIKQFKPMLYILIMLGITGFAISMESAGLWIVSMTLILINAWLVNTGQFKPAPRILINAILLIAVAYAVAAGYDYYTTRAGVPILIVGQFLVIQQLARFWIQETNSDYAQLIVLNLLLLVAAAISTASLAFGVLLIVYLFLSLYCCLLFHLKVETDEAKSAMALPEHRINPNTLKQDQHHLMRSMRRLTMLVAAFALSAAVLAFLFVPRFAAPGRLLGSFQWRPQEPLTGFSEHVDFQQVARIAQDNDPIATVKVWQDGKLASGADTLMLRGITLDDYNGTEWTRNSDSSREQPWEAQMKESWTPDDAPNPAGIHFKQSIQLSPTDTPVLFAIAGLVTITPEHFGSIRNPSLKYSAADESIVSTSTIQRPVEYEVLSTGVLNRHAPDPNPEERSRIDPLITQYARQTNVTGDLASRRDAIVVARPTNALRAPTELDEQIAADIEQHLRTTFSYTLDLTDAVRLQGRDPVVAFLYDLKRGHCEYFAGAMTLLCQSLGMDARMVIGFKCANYNPYGHYYQVSQSDAHAWVEVLTTDGWKTFDPTSGHDAAAHHPSLWQRTRSFVDFLEYTWANAVIAYDADNRQDLISSVETKILTTASAMHFAVIKKFFYDVGGWLATRIVGYLILILSVAIIATIGYYFFERRKLRRRASRIGVDSLPPSAQQRLVRQLLFYSDLLHLLERHQIVRPKHLTPMEFSYGLSYLPVDAYDTIRRLTRLFYRIRYGHSELDPGRQRRLANVIDRLAQTMSNPKVTR